MKHPIKLNVLDKTGKIIIKYIFIGNIPEIKQILNVKNIKINKSAIQILKGEYGVNWKQVLFIDNYTGGFQESPEDEDINTDTTDQLVNDTEVDPEHISLEEIYSISNILENEEKISPDVAIVRSNKMIIKYIFDEIILNSFDNILEFKQKISVLTNIPIYKQNISYNHNKKLYNLNYNIFLQKSVIHVSILNNIINNKPVESIGDIPILINFYNTKNLIKIKTYDTFSILENFTVNLGVIEFNLFNLDNFINQKEIVNNTNKNQLEIIFHGFVHIFWPMLSLTAWIDYTSSTVDFAATYPDIALNIKYKKMFQKESYITENAYELFSSKEKLPLRNSIEKKIFISITRAILQVQSANKRNIINLRNLFDNIKLSTDIVCCKCSLIYNKKNIILHKTFMDADQITIAIPENCLVIKLVNSSWSLLYVYIYTSGNYLIKTNWAGDKLYGFTDIFDIVSKSVNNIINYINRMGSIVVPTNFKLELMTIKNSKFTDIYLSLIYRNPIKFYEFKIIENILNEYVDANIINPHILSNESNILQYYFRKGMYKFNEELIENNIIINNYYLFLTNNIVKSRWEQTFNETRNTTFEYRHGDIKISIEGIKQEEFDTFYTYIINIFDMLEMQKKTYIPKSTAKFNLVKNVKTLKYQDPLLYDFKKIYNSPIVYSRICQKKNQPVILNTEEYNALQTSARKNVVKYWNFTTKSPEYYQCPNPKYPYMHFTVKVHPKDYCIPCCKKKPVNLTTNNIKQMIYNTCMEKHTYSSETKLTSNIKYIMAYGKQITPGRICNLPEQTIEPLFYESFSETQEILESKCKNKYYLYGVEQDIKYTTNVGYISCLAIAMEITINDLMQQTILALKKKAIYFKTIMNGQIVKYFKTMQDLISRIENTFIFDSLQTEKTIPWNVIFIDIAYYYFNIISIVFNDLSTQSSEYIKLQVTNKVNDTHLSDSNYKSLIVIKRNGIYNPIFDINSQIYFSTKIINKKLFAHADPIISIIKKVKGFNTNNKDKMEITLDTLERFMQQLKINNASGKYKITKYFVNSDNLCYYVEVSYKKIVFYVPVTFSVYTTNNNNIDYNQFKVKKNFSNFAHLNVFIKDFNHWIAVISNENGFIKNTIDKFLPLEQTVTPVYSYIIVNKWIYLNNPWANSTSVKTTNDNDKNIIGFICNNINYYHEPLSYNYIRTISKAPLERILYHPDVINSNIVMNAVVDPRVINITRNLYEYHLYELLLLEYTELLNKEKNSEVRHLIKKQIIKRTENNSEQIITEIKSIVNTYYSQHTKDEMSPLTDINNLVNQINNYAIDHKDKNILLLQINSTNYNFDNIKINSFRVMTKPKLILELQKLSKRVVSISTDAQINKALKRTDEFPNMFIACENTTDTVYCKRDKLLITKSNLTDLIEIMASDLLNPFKSKYLFSPLFTDNIISYLKFIHRPNEYIEVHAN